MANDTGLKAIATTLVLYFLPIVMVTLVIVVDLRWLLHTFVAVVIVLTAVAIYGEWDKRNWRGFF